MGGPTANVTRARNAGYRDVRVSAWGYEMSCADICLSNYYDGTNRFYTEQPVRARKNHECAECPVPIPVGATYFLAKGMNEDGFFQYRTCAVCHEIRTAFTCGSWIHETLWEDIRDSMFPVWKQVGAWECLAKLTTQAAIDYCNQRFSAWVRDTDY